MSMAVSTKRCRERGGGQGLPCAVSDQGVFPAVLAIAVIGRGLLNRVCLACYYGEVYGCLNESLTARGWACGPRTFCSLGSDSRRAHHWVSRWGSCLAPCTRATHGSHPWCTERASAARRARITSRGYVRNVAVAPAAEPAIKRLQTVPPPAAPIGYPAALRIASSYLRRRARRGRRVRGAGWSGRVLRAPAAGARACMELSGAARSRGRLRTWHRMRTRWKRTARPARSRPSCHARAL